MQKIETDVNRDPHDDRQSHLQANPPGQQNPRAERDHRIRQQGHHFPVRPGVSREDEHEDAHRRRGAKREAAGDATRFGWRVT